MSQTGRKNYMGYWNFTPEEKGQLIARLTYPKRVVLLE